MTLGKNREEMNMLKEEDMTRNITFKQQDHNNNNLFSPRYNQEKQWWCVKIACYALH